MFLFEATDTNEKESQKGRRSTEAIRLFFSSPAYEEELMLNFVFSDKDVHVRVHEQRNVSISCSC